MTVECKYGWIYGCLFEGTAARVREPGPHRGPRDLAWTRLDFGHVTRGSRCMAGEPMVDKSRDARRHAASARCIRMHQIRLDRHTAHLVEGSQAGESS